MSLYITSLNSGSNGNCYYIGNEREAVLVDAGISCREIERRMKRLGLNIQKVKAIFVSHEHSDHIKGICALVKKYSIPVYITDRTHIACAFTLESHLVQSFNSNEPVVIGDLAITAFSKMHDACDPHSFVVTCGNTKVGVFTDIGTPCKNLIKHFKQCNAAFLESNFDEEMLHSGNYPYYLKKRISGGNGHLSNNQALDLFTQHKPSFMSHLLLSHLSKNNNCPQLVQQLFDQYAAGVKMIVASRDAETEVYYVTNPGKENLKKNYKTSPAQLAFSFV
ncbi:MAG: MBL fold metallo-hydrolase [Segetibacter sp.]